METNEHKRLAMPMVAGLVAVVLAVIWLLSSGWTEPGAPPESALTPSVGSEIGLTTPAYCAPTKDALKRMHKAGDAGRTHWLRQAGEEARAAGMNPLFLGAGDRVRILDAGFVQSRVRALAAEGQPDCWVPSEAIRQ